MCPEEEREEQKREGRGKGGAEEGGRLLNEFSI